MNNARVLVASPGKPEEELKREDFLPLELLYRGQGPHATVSMNVGRALGYGELKVSAHVSLACDQNEETINEAGRRAFLKAAEFCQDGMVIMLERLQDEAKQ